MLDSAVLSRFIASICIFFIDFPVIYYVFVLVLIQSGVLWGWFRLCFFPPSPSFGWFDMWGCVFDGYGC